MTKAEALKAIAEAAVASTKGTQCPAELVAAQAILESGWLKHAPGNNCFGIKARSGDERQLLHTTEWFTDQERSAWLAADPGRTAEPVTPVETDRRGRHKYACQDWFAAYPSLADCFARRVELFDAGRYAPFARAYEADRNFVAYLRGIARIYATDPGYADSCLAIVRQADVAAAIEAARGAIA